MKKILLFSFGFFLVNCADINLTDRASKTIKKTIETNSEGMMKNLKINTVEFEDSTTFKAIYTFISPYNKKMRVTGRYYLNSKLDSIIAKEDFRTEIKSGEKFMTVFENKRFQGR